MLMPNNKAMRFCTGAQMKGFGVAYSRIGERVGDENMVGEVLTEGGGEGVVTRAGLRGLHRHRPFRSATASAARSVQPSQI
jgi:hypothetical protein